MNHELKKAVVVTFVWTDMSLKERSALNQGLKVLGHHPFVIVHPEGYPVDFLLRDDMPNLTHLALPNENFTSVMSYNAMMLTPQFYQHFQQYEYMLIYQTDAWVFSDQLEYWCDKGYDYIGAPWMLNDKLYERTLGQWVTRLMSLMPIRNGHLHSAHIFHHVGNGGFSLRRIATMIDILERNQEFIATLTDGHESMEDVVISIILKEREHLKIPDWHEALYFSWEKAPRLCQKITKGTLPFGCHDTKARYWDSFWSKIITLAP